MPLENALQNSDRRDPSSGRPASAQRFGQRWVEEVCSAVLEVPSGVLLQQSNYPDYIGRERQDVGQPWHWRGNGGTPA
ncbi:MAG: hypothetical protein JO069_06950 [Verrucomicrobia bacterium]|nr:hypothetical protein [Verrucomicrobiota bacterium]